MSFSEEELDELLGAYALDAVDADERAAIEGYLSRSMTAREEVRNHYEVAMALATTPGQAPTALWDRIEANMTTSPQPAAELGFHIPVFSRPRGKRSLKPGRGLRNSGHAVTFPGLRWAAPTVAAALLAATLATVTIRQHDTIRNLRTEVAAVRTTARSDQARANEVERLLATSTSPERVIQQLLTTRGTTIAHLDTPSGESVVDVILAPNGQGYLVSKALPTLVAGHTYQLWGVADNVVLSLGVFGAAPKTLEFAAHERWTKFVLTEEKSPGVPTSSQPAMAVGDVQSI